jgi:ankyrin repeat protein
MCIFPSANARYPPLICFLSVRVVLAATVCSQGKNTPLHCAAAGGHAEMAKVLLAAGANVHSTVDVSG